MKPQCPVHHCPLRRGPNGWFCPKQRRGDNCRSTWAKFKPPKPRAVKPKVLREKLPAVKRGSGWPKVADDQRLKDLYQCQICGKLCKSPHVDHVIPARMFETPEEGNAAPKVTLCAGHHSLKTQLDRKLFAGDVLGFLHGLELLAYPAEAIAWARTWLLGNRQEGVVA